MQSSLLDLKPGDKLIVPALDPYLISSTGFSPQDSTYAEIAWVKNDLCFRGATLPDLVPTLQRWYGVKIDLKGGDRDGPKFSAWMTDRGLDRTLALLQQAQPFHYTIDGQEVHISP
jgi:transmembrane sensor